MAAVIDRETLLRIAKLHSLRPWQQEKHYVQSLVLVALAEHPLVFKGGTYLWFFHGLRRFSEDLDFTASGRIPGDLAKEVSESLRLFGVENTVKRRQWSFRISAQGPLHTTEKDLCHVAVDVSAREQVQLPTQPLTVQSEPYGLPVKMLSGMDLREVAAEKVRAMMTRGQARDLFDLAFLLDNRRAVPSIALVEKKLELSTTGFTEAAFRKSIREKKASWSAELKPLVFSELQTFDSAARSARAWLRAAGRI